MTITLHPEEPPAGHWREERIHDVFTQLVGRAEMVRAGPVIVAIDGRSTNEDHVRKARRRGHARDRVVHTDDIAWFHSRFGWADLALRVLETAHAGESLTFRPPAWDERHREGAIVLPSGIQLLLFEGVGPSREELAHLLDARLWVQADRVATDQRDDHCIAAGAFTRSAAEEWMAEELPFVAGRRPWEHADLVIGGTPQLPHDPSTEVVVADGPLRW